MSFDGYAAAVRGYDRWRTGYGASWYTRIDRDGCSEAAGLTELSVQIRSCE